MASRRALHLLAPSRGISSTPHLAAFGWFDKIKFAFTGKKPEDATSGADSFTLLECAETAEQARKWGASNGLADEVAEYEKHSAVLRYLGAIDPTGEKLQTSDKINASKHCNCTVAEVEHILEKFRWVKEAEKKIQKLKEEGKPFPMAINEMQNLVESPPTNVDNSNLAKERSDK